MQKWYLSFALACGCSVFYAAQPNLSQHGDAGACQFLEVFFNHAMLQDRSPCMNSDAAGAKR